jgi:hypothetical protein
LLFLLRLLSLVSFLFSLLVANGDLDVIVGATVNLDATASDMMPDFDMSQELHDYLIDDGVEENSPPMEEDNWYDDLVNHGNLIGNEDATIEEECTPSFRNTYAASLTQVIKLVDKLFARSMWSGRHVVTHPPAHDSDIAALMQVLRKISPSIGESLKIDASTIKNHPEIQKVLDNHTRGSAYFRQFFKRPLVAGCDCIPCKEGMFSPMIMPNDAYEELCHTYAMPLPIPKPGDTISRTDMHYMSFEEAVKEAFTDIHQPSLRGRRRANNSSTVGQVAIGDRELRSSESDQHKITQGKFIRGIVTCKDCAKPRCLYSITSPNRMKPLPANGGSEPTAEAIRLCRQFAMQKLEEAQDHDLYVCGMQPFDADDMMHGVIVARDGLECLQPIEFEYYSNPKMVASWFNPNMCAYCAGSSGAGGVVDAELSIEWKSVLPVCPTCRTDGALPPVRSRRRNGASHESRAQRARLTSQAPQAHVDGSTHVNAASTEPNMHNSTVAPMSVSRRRGPRLPRDRDAQLEPVVSRPRKDRSRRFVRTE